jgi:PTH1 family peptidyl-tRNA hydrolase
MFPYIKKLFGESKYILKSSNPMKKYLLLGLGNIGEEYTGTRHNIGFQALDALAREENFSFETRKLGEVGNFKLKGRHILALKPSTYMNRSGKALNYWLEKEKIPLEHVLVITDDLNLPFGTLRLKAKGSDGGHNGLRDLQQNLGHTDYHRLRFGVGDGFRKGQQVDYVLGQWSDEEAQKLKERLERLTQMIRSFVLAGPKITMNEFNGT